MISDTQLTLKLSPSEIYQLDNFLFAEKRLHQAVEEFCPPLRELPFLYLCGETGTGKSHLTLAIASFCEQAKHSVAYLNLNELKTTVSPESLASLISAEIIFFDDLEAVASDTAWEEALFHAFNAIRLAEKQVVIATLHTPTQLLITLPDLRSRLATGLVFQLPQMQDALKQRALILQAQSRGVILAEEVSQYLLRHYGRDMPSLMAVLNKLDKASLQAQRRLTIPFVREVMQRDK